MRVRTEVRNRLPLAASLGLALVLLCGLSLNCVHTVDYENKLDTVPKAIPPQGPVLVRFLSILDNSGWINLYPSLNTSTPLTTVRDRMEAAYFPFVADTSIVLYANFTLSKIHSDSITIATNTLRPLSFYSTILFQSHPSSSSGQDTGLVAIFVNDSMKTKPAAVGYCYLRFINGLPDYPVPTPLVNLHIDNKDAEPFFKDSAGNSNPVYYQELRNYVPFPIGSHTIFVTKELNQSDQPWANTFTFAQGKYYTLRLAGVHDRNSDRLYIDEE